MVLTDSFVLPGDRCTFAWAAAKLPKVPGSQKRLSEDFHPYG
jgi:hypothetical protein